MNKLKVCFISASIFVLFVPGDHYVLTADADYVTIGGVLGHLFFISKWLGVVSRFSKIISDTQVFEYFIQFMDSLFYSLKYFTMFLFNSDIQDSIYNNLLTNITKFWLLFLLRLNAYSHWVYGKHF